MSRHSFFLLLLVSLLEAISARSLDTQRRCEDRYRACSIDDPCGTSSCYVMRRCCKTLRFGAVMCDLFSVNVRECGSFQCVNGGTRLSLRGKREIKYDRCDIPPPQCACPQGFGGRCCEELIDPCNYTKCGDGQICKSVEVFCKKAPCPLKAICVPDAGICPLFPNTITTCELEPFACRNDSDCSDGQLCCKRGCGLECVKSLPTGTAGCARVVCRNGTVCRETSVGVLCPVKGPCKKKVECVPEVVEPTVPEPTVLESIDTTPTVIEYDATTTTVVNPTALESTGPVDCTLVPCPNGQICTKKVFPCLIPPCPEQHKCVLPDLCDEVQCPIETSCVVDNGRIECVRRGTCPKFPGLITTCEVRSGHCLSDIECQTGEKCCIRGCGRECVSVVTGNGDIQQSSRIY
ncbi:fibropellin-1-like [Corticium candelabrum]|uniref:fibropellin-1-like n=1 Tax=Corticium candelabrum TaxID=121492 RepID=UPI002E272971|nr:fibropellin-1-like [Corticium candelabrum]